MSQCVPSWDLDDPPNPPTHLPFNHLPSPAPLVPMSDYEFAELAWENGRLVLHGLGHDRIAKPVPKEHSTSAAAIAWEKPRPSGTLEAIVDQATRAQLLPSAPSPDLAGPQDHRSTQTKMHALVPCTAPRRDGVADPGIGRKRPRVGEAGWVCASQGSAAVPGAGRRGESSRVTLDTCGGDDVGFTTTTATNSTSPSRSEGDDGGSPETENTSFSCGGGGGGGGGRRLPAFDDLDSVCLSQSKAALSFPLPSYFHSPKIKKNFFFFTFFVMLVVNSFIIYFIYWWVGAVFDCGQADGDDGVCADEEKVMKGRVSASARRSRAAAVHNQSERKRRDRINQKMKALQKLVPNSSKTDKASMLDEVIEYLKRLQAQVQMMSTMMMPMTMPQLQMSMMAQMARMARMGMGMGMMDLNSLCHLGHAGLPPLVHHSAFLPLPAACWDGSGDKMQQLGGTVRPDPFSTFQPYQTSQPPPPTVGMDACNWMAALHQQLRWQPPPGNPEP